MTDERAMELMPDNKHYLGAIRRRLEQLYDASADDPRLREQLSDEVDWIDEQITPSLDSGKREGAEWPQLSDNDAGEITVTFDGKELRGWSYANDDERQVKMFAAREYVEGFGDGRDAK